MYIEIPENMNTSTIRKYENLIFFQSLKIISSKIKLNWDMDDSEYLGVNICRELTSLCDLNLNLLSQKIKEDIRS